jgi:C-terminal processing protease CtpA/Prc
MKSMLLVASAMLSAANAYGFELTSADREAVVRAVIAHLETDYVDASVGAEAAKELRSQLEDGAFAAVRSGAEFAEALTQRLRDATKDGHLTVEFSEKSLEGEDAADNAAFTAQEMERYYGAHLNFGVRKAERLEGNIGLLELSVFPPAAMGGDIVAAAMQVIAHTDALIIDLRHNGGGSDTVALVASYLFEDRQPLSGIYNRPNDATRQSYTQAYVPGARFGSKKPVYVLVSKRTFSAAEALAYDLQALKRATIVGEPTGGGAHPFSYRRVHPHFVLWSVTEKSINPITGKNWQGTGVQPDVRVEPKQALAKVLELIATSSPSKNGAQHESR